MSHLRNSLLVVLGVAALALPAGAVAGHGESHGNAKGHAKNGKAKGHANGQGKGQAKPQAVGYLFKGFYAGDGTVEVKRGNAHVRKAGLIGEMVEFDLSDARFVVRDTNGDGKRSIEDVAAGDWVLVKSRLPRTDPGSQPFEARWLIDKTKKPLPSDGDET
jgi:hypothetical protein